MYKTLLKPIFFRFDPETAHTLALRLFKTALWIPGFGSVQDVMNNADHPSLSKNLFGLKFKNPVGLAAGFDKNAEYIHLMARLGFGHIEVGTVTPKAQPGNEKPRLFRLPADHALINRMGFNNDGVDVMVQNLQKKYCVHAREKYSVIIGGNIGKNKITPNEEAWKDYVICFEKLFDYVDYFVVNVSSPNTPGLRELQEKEPLKNILSRLQEINQKKKPKPLLLKISPDLSVEQIHDIMEISRETNLSGIIATNTTISRENLKTPSAQIEKAGNGGLSGAPLRAPSDQVISYLKKNSGNNLPVIGVGGIATAADARDKLNLGADLLQLYTGMIYEGHGVVRKILQGLDKKQ